MRCPLLLWDIVVSLAKFRMLGIEIPFATWFGIEIPFATLLVCLLRTSVDMLGILGLLRDKYSCFLCVLQMEVKITIMRMLLKTILHTPQFMSATFPMM